MATKTRHSGTARTDYEADRARIENLQALTADTDKLLHRLVKASEGIAFREASGKEGTLASLLKNHVLTVLADIRRKGLAGYGDTFAGVQGTAEQAYYVRKLRKDVNDWVQRLEAFLHISWQRTSKDSDSVAVAKELLAKLQSVIHSENDIDNHSYYQMLRTVSDIQANADRYQKRIEDSGDTDPAIALLLCYIDNYASIATGFNNYLCELPKIYHSEMLHVKSPEAVPDNTYVVVTPARGGFSLAKGTAFMASEELTYKTTKKENVSPVKCVAVQAVRATTEGTFMQTLDFENTETEETLFVGGKELHAGWQIESPMLVLEDGKREITISFMLAGTAAIATRRQNGFGMSYSTAEGWTTIDADCMLDNNRLTFSATIGREGIAPTPCTEEAHGMTTEYPTLRIVSTHAHYPTWAEGLVFTEARIEVNVTGCRNFTFMNELGEADTSQPLTPFGVQAERGAWFIFGNKETGLKPLKKVMLTGTWQKIPNNQQEINEIYEPYEEDIYSFNVTTEWLWNRNWYQHEGGRQPLFLAESNGTLRPAQIVLDFQSQSHASNGMEYPHNKDGYFRVTLDSPRIGFGMAAYRELFAEVMMHNSRCKEKNMKALPKEPTTPQLIDVEMAYEAIASSSSSHGNMVKITPVAVAESDIVPPREGEGRLLPIYPSSHMLYMAFANSCGESSVRIYLDMALSKDKIPYYHPDPDMEIHLAWQYWNGVKWVSIPSKNVFAEETEGLTQSGFVEITFDGRIGQEWLDSQGRLWLRAMLTSAQGLTDSDEEDSKMEDADTSGCLALRSVSTNCLLVRAVGGDGSPLPAGTIKGTVEENPRIGTVSQPLPGFGGSPVRTSEQERAHQTARFANRHRAVTAKDYEQILMEHYPEVEMAICLTLPKSESRPKPEVRVVVFSKADDSDYYLSAPWKLNEMERTLRQYAPAFVELKVVNPLYEKVTVECTGTLHFGVRDRGEVENDLIFLTENYFMSWRRKGELPSPGKVYSFKGLRARLVNHEDLQRVVSLTVNGKEYSATNDDEGDAIMGKEPWSVLIPEVKIQLFTPDDGVGLNGIGYDFVIG